MFDSGAGVTFTPADGFPGKGILISIVPTFDTDGPVYDGKFTDSYSSMVLNHGKICDDERWLIGQGMMHEVTVLFFLVNWQVMYISRYFIVCNYSGF